MRSDEEIKQLILKTAEADPRIRAMILNGSRANPNAPADKFRDFDIVYYVNDLKSFTSDHSWIDVFGERIILQMPDEMELYPGDADKYRAGFSYLMLFKDGSRIDLTLFPVSSVNKDYRPESLSIVWLDKDGLLTGIKLPSDKDHHITKPSAKLFADTCNEFWWVSTYSAKALARGEITYAREVTETIIRPMFMRIVNWYIGTETDFSVSTGKGGKYLQKYLPPGLYNKFLLTYPDADIERNKTSLLVMTKLFASLAKHTAGKLGYKYNIDEEANVMAYFESVFKGSSDIDT
ncbi:MAG TPA: aminoglycoside 6-adenylyltransferase [Ignavibacteria bacterium]|nr:aminoglycoside 6-adenylyltransferase [Ignavibacteria bacterium]